VLAVVEAQEVMQAAGLEWDHHAGRLARTHAEYLANCPGSLFGLADAAKHAGVDITGWHFGRIEKTSGYYADNLSLDLCRLVHEQRSPAS
jgi:hypothetical protein